MHHKGKQTGLTHLLELHNVWVYKPLVIEDLSLHIFGDLQGL